jgi:hypothetical protein
VALQLFLQLGFGFVIPTTQDQNVLLHAIKMTYLYDHIRTTGSHPPVASRFWYRIPFSPSTVEICLPFAGALKLNEPGMLAGDQETAFTPMACAWNFSPSAEPSSMVVCKFTNHANG